MCVGLRVATHNGLFCMSEPMMSIPAHLAYCATVWRGSPLPWPYLGRFPKLRTSAERLL